MVKFVNPMEQEYPAAGNIVPETVLEKILRKEAPAEWGAMLWLLGKFALQSPQHALKSNDISYSDPNALFDLYRVSTATQASVDAAVKQVADASASWQPPEGWRENADAFNDVVLALLARMEVKEWQALFDLSGTGTLGIYRASPSRMNIKEVLQEEARGVLIDHGAQVVVMGHTHQPDEVTFAAGQYFNPGSWTRYADVKSIPHLSREHLKDDKWLPYELNYIEIRRDTKKTVQGRKLTFERAAGTI